MAKYDGTKFFWLQLMEDFFDEDAIEWLEEQPQGKEYSLFYLKLCLKSLRTNGILIRKVGNMLIPYNEVKLGEMTNTHPDTVIVAINLLIQIGLVQKLDNGALYLTQVEHMIGSQSKGAFKKQLQLARREMQIDAIFEEGGKGVEKVPPEKEKELELELNININNIPSSPYKEIIDYLNIKAKTNYKSTTKKTQTLIKARINEGFTINDFKTVIDHKVDDWLNDRNMREYLRPETLFGTKFEGYLNQRPKKTKPIWYDEYLENERNKQNEKNKKINKVDESLEELEDFFSKNVC